MNTVDVLREAKAILSDPSRWSKTDYGTHADDAPMCAAGAIHVASGCRAPVSAYASEPALMALMNVVDPTDRLWGCIAAWNDDPKTTHADLIDAFDRAILAVSEAETVFPQPAKADPAPASLEVSHEPVIA